MGRAHIQPAGQGWAEITCIFRILCNVKTGNQLKSKQYGVPAL